MDRNRIALLALRLENLADALARPSAPAKGGWSARPEEAQHLRDLATDLKAEALNS